MAVTSDCSPSVWRCGGINTSSGITVLPAEIQALNNVTVSGSAVNFPSGVNYSASAGSLGLTTAQWNDLMSPALSFGKTVNAPSLTSITGNILSYGFQGDIAQMQQLFGSFELQHDYKEGTDLRPHIHWATDSSTTGTVVWNLEYSVLNVSSVAGTATTVSASQAAAGIGGFHQAHEFPVITGTNIKIGTHIFFRIFRDCTVANDTYNATAVLLSVGIHYQCSSVGSNLVFGN